MIGHESYATFGGVCLDFQEEVHFRGLWSLRRICSLHKYMFLSQGHVPFTRTCSIRRACSFHKGMFLSKDMFLSQGMSLSKAMLLSKDFSQKYISFVRGKCPHDLIKISLSALLGNFVTRLL